MSHDLHVSLARAQNIKWGCQCRADDLRSLTVWGSESPPCIGLQVIHSRLGPSVVPDDNSPVLRRLSTI